MDDRFLKEYTDWRDTPVIDKFYDFEEFEAGAKYLEKFIKDIENVLELVPEDLKMSDSPELDGYEVLFHWYCDGRMLSIRIESGEKDIRYNREPDAFCGEFKFGDAFDGIYEGQINLENKERIKKLFKWLLDE